MLTSMHVVPSVALVVGATVVAGLVTGTNGAETAGQPSGPAATQRSQLSKHQYEQLTARELTAALGQTSLVYFPIGSLEFHGPHLPLGMDTIHAHEFCLRAARQTGGVVLPATYWGTKGHEGWPGSLLVSESALRALVRDVFALLCEQRVKVVVATTGHWPSKQGAMIAELAAECMGKHPETKILVLDPYGCNPHDQEADHGGRKETSIMLALRPELVHMERLRDDARAFEGIGKNAGDGSRQFGEDYLNASLARYVEIVKATLHEYEHSR